MGTTKSATMRLFFSLLLLLLLLVFTKSFTLELNFFMNHCLSSWWWLKVVSTHHKAIDLHRNNFYMVWQLTVFLYFFSSHLINLTLELSHTLNRTFINRINDIRQGESVSIEKSMNSQKKFWFTIPIVYITRLPCSFLFA